MSTILRALKKLEHDKANRKPEQADLDLEFLESTPPPPRRSALKGLLAVAFLVACGSGATYLYMAGSMKQPAPPQPAAPQPRQAVMKAVSAALPLPAPMTRLSSAAILPAAAKVQPVTPSKQTTAARPPAPQAPRVPKAQPYTTPAPSLTVNGIALSDGEKRKAIVNGMSVSVGSSIQGARVEEIMGNRVRFSYNGKTFEISVGNTGP